MASRHHARPQGNWHLRVLIGLSLMASCAAASAQSVQVPLIPLTPKEQTSGPDPISPADSSPAETTGPDNTAQSPQGAPVGVSSDSAAVTPPAATPPAATPPAATPPAATPPAATPQQNAYQGPLLVRTVTSLRGAAPNSPLSALPFELRPEGKVLWSETGQRGALQSQRPEIRRTVIGTQGRSSVTLEPPQHWNGLMLPETPGCQLRSQSAGWSAITEWWVSWPAGPQGQWSAGAAQMSAQTSQGRAALIYAREDRTLDDVLVCAGTGGTQIGFWGQLRRGWNLLVARRSQEEGDLVIRVTSVPITRPELTLTLTPGSLLEAPAAQPPTP